MSCELLCINCYYYEPKTAKFASCEARSPPRGGILYWGGREFSSPSAAQLALWTPITGGCTVSWGQDKAGYRGGSERGQAGVCIAGYVLVCVPVTAHGIYI